MFFKKQNACSEISLSKLKEPAAVTMVFVYEVLYLTQSIAFVCKYV